jgi:hypothetical protein
VTFDPARFRLYAGSGRHIPDPLSETDFIDEFDSREVAQKMAWRQEETKDWWAIFDTETGKHYSTWTTGRTAPHLRSK